MKMQLWGENAQKRWRRERPFSFWIEEPEMTSSEDQEWAAASIDPSSLEEAKGVIVAGCRLFLERLDRLEGGGWCGSGRLRT